jgi:hypothetical protein
VHAADPPAVRWAAAAALGGRGRYGAAYALLDGLVRDPSAPLAVRAHAAVTRASHLRQLGGHGPARRWDGMGLALATAALQATAPTSRVASHIQGAPRTGPAVCQDHRGYAKPPGAAHGVADAEGSLMGFDATAARIDAVLGLAADALGLLELGLSGRLLDEIGRDALAHPSWRPEVRLYWIRAELALCTDDPRRAREEAERAVALARAAGAVRHQVKSELVTLVARSVLEGPVGPVRDALEELSERARLAHLSSLEWPTRLLLTRLCGPEERERADRHLAGYHQLLRHVRGGCDPFGRLVLDRSPWVEVDPGA